MKSYEPVDSPAIFNPRCTRAVLLPALVLLIWFSFGWSQDLPEMVVAPDGWKTKTLFNFSGGLNTNTFAGNLPEDQAVTLTNLVMVYGQPTFRPGYSNYATISSNRGLRGIFAYNRSVDNKRLTFVADSGFMWADTATGSFYSITGSGTLDSTKYIQAVPWKDSLVYVDGVQDPKKTDAKTVYDGTVVDTGKVVFMSPTGQIRRDTTTTSKVLEDAVVSVIHPDSNFGSEEGSIVSKKNRGDTTRYFFKVDLSYYQAGDSITSYKIKFGIRQLSGFSFTNDTLYLKRVTSGSWNENGLTWNNQPTIGTVIYAKARITSGFLGDVEFEIGSIIDTIVNGTYSNLGFVVMTDEAGSGATAFEIRQRESQLLPPRITDKVVWSPTNLWAKGHPRLIVDTFLASKFIDNDLAGFFFYSVQDTQYRQIVGNRNDTLEIYPPLINPLWETNRIGTYRIYAKPSSIDNIDSGHVDSATYQSISDSLFRLWIGANSGITPREFNNGSYYLKITRSARWEGNQQILSNDTAGGKDYLIVFAPNLPTVNDTTLRFEVFQAKFPLTADVFVGGNRIFYMQADKPYVWFSEANNTAQVEPDNFYILGGEKLTALFGLAPTALSGFSDRLNLMFAASNSSIWGLDVNDPDVAVPQRVSGGVGISFKNSIVYLPEGGVDWLNPKGQAYRFNGRDVQKLSLTIPDRFDSVVTISVGNISGFHFEGVDYWWVTNPGNTSALGYNLSVTNNAWAKHDVPFGTALRQFLPSDSIPVLIGALNTGKIFKFGRAVTDTGLSINIRYKTGWVWFDNPTTFKELQTLWFSFRATTTEFGGPKVKIYGPVSNDRSFYSLTAPTLLDSATFAGSIGYQDRLHRFRFRPGVIAPGFQIEITASGQLKLGWMGLIYRQKGRAG